MIPLLTNAPLNNRAQDFRHPFNTADSSMRINLPATTNFMIPFASDAKIAVFSYPEGGTLFLSPNTISAFPSSGTSDTGIYKLNPHIHEITTPELYLLSLAPLVVVVNFYSR